MHRATVSAHLKRRRVVVDLFSRSSHHFDVGYYRQLEIELTLVRERARQVAGSIGRFVDGDLVLVGSTKFWVAPNFVSKACQGNFKIGGSAFVYPNTKEVMKREDSEPRT